MMNIGDKTKRNLLIAGLGIICVALIFAISSRFQKEKQAETVIAPTPAITGEVNPRTDGNTSTKNAEENKVTVKIEEPTQTPAGSTTVQTDQTMQNLQPAVTKPPEPAPSQKTDPNKAPDGEKKDTTAPANHDKVTTPKNNSSSSTPKAGDKNDKGEVYFPGFGWIKDEGGGSSGTKAKDMYENGNKIGQMN